MVTYLLGAGASAKALPLVGDDFKRRVEIFVQELRRINSYNNEMFSSDNLFVLILDQIKLHASPDTYAKKLFLLGKEWESNYYQFKTFLSCYIIWEQLNKKYLEQEKNQKGDSKIEKIFTTLDYRYDVLCAAIQEKSATLPKNFSLVTWNYDLQFERTLHQYEKPGIPLHQTFQGLVDDNKIYRLNGSAWFEYQDGEKIIYPFDNLLINDNDYLKLFCEIIKDEKSKYRNHLRFAWEKNEDSINKAQNSFVQSNSAVIIGYSFPYYNRSIDWQILSTFRGATKKNIYLQYPTEEEFHKIKDKLILMFASKLNWNEDTVLTQFNFIPIVNHDQFYIPDELL